MPLSSCFGNKRRNRKSRPDGRVCHERSTSPRKRKFIVRGPPLFRPLIALNKIAFGLHCQDDTGKKGKCVQWAQGVQCVVAPRVREMTRRIHDQSHPL